MNKASIRCAYVENYDEDSRFTKAIEMTDESEDACPATVLSECIAAFPRPEVVLARALIHLDNGPLPDHCPDEFQRLVDAARSYVAKWDELDQKREAIMKGLTNAV